jgi:hypothetical protein
MTILTIGQPQEGNVKNLFYFTALLSMFLFCCIAKGITKNQLEYLGSYSDQVSSNDEDPHLQGYKLDLFREGDLLFGRFCFATGIEVPCASIEEVKLSLANHYISFHARIIPGVQYGPEDPPEGRPWRALFEFRGMITAQAVFGNLVLKNGYDPNRTEKIEFVILERDDMEGMRRYVGSYAKWSADPVNRPLSDDWKEQSEKSVAINEKLWARIDKVNETLQKANKPISTKLLAEILAEAVSVMKDPEFSKDYESILDNAIKNDEVQANLLSERAEPAFAIFFGGDYEFTQVNWNNYFSHQL